MRVSYVIADIMDLLMSVPGVSRTPWCAIFDMSQGYSAELEDMYCYKI